jgi:hypothetical protein
MEKGDGDKPSPFSLVAPEPGPPLQRRDAGGPALLDHRLRPDAGVHLADVQLAQKEHAQARLADAAAHAQGPLARQQPPVPVQRAARRRPANLQLLQERVPVDPNPRARSKQNRPTWGETGARPHVAQAPAVADWKRGVQGLPGQARSSPTIGRTSSQRAGPTRAPLSLRGTLRRSNLLFLSLPPTREFVRQQRQVSCPCGWKQIEVSSGEAAKNTRKDQDPTLLNRRPAGAAR